MTVFNGPFAATLQVSNVSQTFDFNIILTTPFLYDPSQGNLLVEVNVVSSSGPLNGFWAGDSPLTGRNYNDAPNNTGAGVGPNGLLASNFGLLTQFTFTPAAPTAVPEPATMLLLSTGLAGTAALRKRRKARKSEEA